jgi:SH3-like domain-containing protein
VRSEPQKAGSSILLLHEGAKVYVIQSLESWRKIELTDGTEGWIDASAIKEVK